MYSKVDVRKPDVRFGDPDENMSGFRIVRISDVRFTTNRPVFELYSDIRNPDKLSGFQTTPIARTSDNRTKNVRIDQNRF